LSPSDRDAPPTPRRGRSGGVGGQGATAAGSSRPSWRGVSLGVGATLALLVAAALGLVRHVPGFYLRGEAATRIPEAEVLARRTVSKASAWHASLSRQGEWDAAVTADELNAWLALDLPRNHPRWLPRGVSAPRVEFRPRHLTAGARVGAGPLSAIAWADLEVVLRGRNQVTISVERARLGAVPLPTAPLIGDIARRLRRLGMVTELRRVGGRTSLAVYIPSTHDAGATSYWLESMAFEDGEWLAAGRTRGGGSRQARAIPLAR
jgi:hypothetical protein